MAAHRLNIAMLILFSLPLSMPLLLSLSVDHVGVSNAQLVKERVPLAAHYSDRSVAEQNSLDLSWDLLMSDDYVDLRAFLFPTKEELVRFRQLVVNVRSVRCSAMLLSQGMPTSSNLPIAVL